VNVFVAVGEMMGFAADESRRKTTPEYKGRLKPRVYTFQDSAETARKISGIIREGDVVLIKGSRVMGMEKILERIKV
jgi:UDP-N-acetylmuramyl pentapeptide synthase